MIKVRESIDFKWKKDTYYVYENEEEFSKAQKHLNLVFNPDYVTAKEGEYIRTDNGYYCPVLYNKDYEPKNKRTIIKHLRLPGKVHKLFKYKNTGKIRVHKLIYSRDLEKVELAQVSARQKMFIEMVLAGYGFDDAYDKIYVADRKSKNNHKTMTKQKLLLKLFNSNVFRKYLKEKVMDIKQEFTEAKCNGTWFAENMMKIVEDAKQPAAVRIEAIKTIKDVITLPDRTALPENVRHISQVNVDLDKHMESMTGLKVVNE